MSDRCVDFREMSPGGREMVTSDGEREKHRAWTHDGLYGDYDCFFCIFSVFPLDIFVNCQCSN